VAKLQINQSKIFNPTEAQQAMSVYLQLEVIYAKLWDSLVFSWFSLKQGGGGYGMLSEWATRIGSQSLVLTGAPCEFKPVNDCF
jgi:hypothetical protein